MNFKREPITSYGIILFHVDQNKHLYYLLSQRRDTIEYTEFIRGRYTFQELETFFKNMTFEERERIEKYSFDELWDDLWVDHSNTFYKEIKPRASIRFDTNKYLIEKYLCNTTTCQLEPSWGFPKGRRNSKESEIDCAFREFNEESTLCLNYINLLNTAPVTEVFKGTNDKMYSTVYYIAQTNERLEWKKQKLYGRIRTETISEEISNLRWCTLGEALLLLKPWRQKLLIDLEIKLRSYLKLNDSF